MTIAVDLGRKATETNKQTISVKTVIAELSYPRMNRLSNSYTMGCPPVRGDNPRAVASGLSYVQVDNPWYNYFIPPTSV